MAPGRLRKSECKQDAREYAGSLTTTTPPRCCVGSYALLVGFGPKAGLETGDKKKILAMEKKPRID